MRLPIVGLLALLLALPGSAFGRPDLFDRVKDGYAD